MTDMTKEDWFKEIKRIQSEYPKSYCSPPVIGIIQHLDAQNNIQYEELIGCESNALLIYAEQAKRSHGLVSSIDKIFGR